MEAPDYCFAFNFLRANSTSTARGCCVRPAGTSPERGQHTQPPTHTPQTASCTLPRALPCCCGYLQTLPPGGWSLRGRGSLRTADVGPQRFGCHETGSAERRGGCRHGPPWARCDPAQTAPASFET